jgi:hypothetical protein
VARGGELPPKSFLVVLEAHHCADPAATTTNTVECSLGVDVINHQTAC